MTVSVQQNTTLGGRLPNTIPPETPYVCLKGKVALGASGAQGRLRVRAHGRQRWRGEARPMLLASLPADFSGLSAPRAHPGRGGCRWWD